MIRSVTWLPCDNRVAFSVLEVFNNELPCSGLDILGIQVYSFISNMATHADGPQLLTDRLMIFQLYDGVEVICIWLETVLRILMLFWAGDTPYKTLMMPGSGSCGVIYPRGRITSTLTMTVRPHGCSVFTFSPVFSQLYQVFHTLSSDRLGVRGFRQL